MRRIFAETGLPRLRLSSIEPMDWDRDLIALMSEFGGSRLARHAHLPLQSGSDAVLRRMHRRYRPWHYAEKVAALFDAAGPELTLGADVMVGFPGETDAEFEETLEFIRALPFGYLHLFPFSPRPGTRGWSLHAESPVPAAVVEERMAALRALAVEKSRAHRSQFLGCELDAITLHTSPALAAADRTSALTENFLPVEVEGALPANRLVRIRVTGFDRRRSARRNPRFTRYFRAKLPRRTVSQFCCKTHAKQLLDPLPPKNFAIQPVLYSGCVRAPSKSPDASGSRRPKRVEESTIALDKRSAKSFIRINDRIRAREIRVIDENGEQLGILPPFEALKIARERGLDLVEVSPNAVPPVCRIQDYGRFLYEKEKSERAARKKQKVIVVKEVKFSVTVDEHDYQTKKNQAVKFPDWWRQGQGEPPLPRPSDGPPRSRLQHHQPAHSGHR